MLVEKVLVYQYSTLIKKLVYIFDIKKFNIFNILRKNSIFLLTARIPYNPYEF